jgi:molybdopterin synthase sulfur carrier subunit
VVAKWAVENTKWASLVSLTRKTSEVPASRWYRSCTEDLSHKSPDTLLPPEVAAGTEPFLIIGAIAGG